MTDQSAFERISAAARREQRSRCGREFEGRNHQEPVDPPVNGAGIERPLADGHYGRCHEATVTGIRCAHGGGPVILVDEVLHFYPPAITGSSRC